MTSGWGVLVPDVLVRRAGPAGHGGGHAGGDVLLGNFLDLNPGVLVGDVLVRGHAGGALPGTYC